MIRAELPVDEEMRLSDLVSYEIQDADTEEDFDELSALVAQYFNCPIALITVIDSDRQWFKGKTGTTETGNTRELSFCSHTLLHEDVMVVEDASTDERFFDNPFVAGAFHIRFYAGAPIVSTDGYKLGTVCIYNIVPQKLSDHQKQALQLFSKQVTKLLELRKKNILLHQRAQELIALKSEVFARFIHSQEEDKKAIAFNLHEDFAQGIAASLLMLQTAQKATQHRTILTAKTIEQLKEILVNIRTLSYSITPNMPDWISTDQLILKLIEKIGVAFPFKITVENTGQFKGGSADNTLCAIRIIEQWLKVLLRKKGIGLVQITVAYGDHFLLSIQDDGSKESFADRKKDVIESIIYERAHAQGGTVELSQSPEGKNLLKVLLPVTK
jgi:GAF domain-containing protein